MAGHQKTIHNLPSDHVFLHDLGNVRLRAGPIPDAFGVDNNTGTILAVVQTPRLVGPDNPLQPEAIHFLLHKFLKPDGSTVGAASSRIALRPLIDAHEDV